MRRHRLAWWALAAWCVAPSASAGPITYNLTIDTSSIAGTVGSLDFNFNPGPLVTQQAALDITGFSTDGTLGSAVKTGDVTGTLPAALAFDNLTAFNDYFTGFTFGSTLSFSVGLSGPALSTPDGVSTSGSSMAFSMFSDAAGTVPALTTNAVDGFAFVVDVNLDGTTTVQNFSRQVSGFPAGPPVPEPASLLLFGSGLAAAMVKRRRRAA